MDPVVAATPMEATLSLQPTAYSRIAAFVAGAPVSGLLEDVVRGLSLTTEAEQQRIMETLDQARYPTLATRRLFFLACKVGRLPLMELLCPMCDIESVDEYGKTALLRSAVGGQLRVVEFLLDHGANPLTNGSFVPLIRSALTGGNMKVVELLLQLAGDREDVSEILGDNQELFFRAVYNDRVDFAAFLLAYVRSVKMAELLSAHGADFGWNAGLEAVVAAMAVGNTPLVEFFLAHGVDIRRLQYRTTSPLHCACIHRRIDLIEIVASQCVDLDARLEDGSTALQKCFLGGGLGQQAHQLLVDLGADVNARSNSGADSKYRSPSPWFEPQSTFELWRSKASWAMRGPTLIRRFQGRRREDNDRTLANEIT